MNTSVPLTIAERAAQATPDAIARRVRGLSDRAISWLFISPTVLLLLALNVFPLVWTVRLSFTNFRANRPNAPVAGVGPQYRGEDAHGPEHSMVPPEKSVLVLDQHGGGAGHQHRKIA